MRLFSIVSIGCIILLIVITVNLITSTPRLTRGKIVSAEFVQESTSVITSVAIPTSYPSIPLRETLPPHWDIVVECNGKTELWRINDYSTGASLSLGDSLFIDDSTKAIYKN